MKFVKLSLLACVIVTTALGVPAPSNLKCDFRVDPLGIEISKPPFSWHITDERHGAKQTAYQIQLSLRSDFKTLVWDSGGVVSRQSHLVEYAGAPLSSATRYYWRVRYWDQDRQVSPWSQSAFFEMGLLSVSDWKAQWIQPQEWESNDSPDFMRWSEMMAFPPESVHGLDKSRWADWDENILGRFKGLTKLPYFRKEITLRKPVQSARLRYSAVGHCEARINGQQVTDNRLDPAVRQYSEAVNYVTLDVTDKLRSGANAIGLILDDGWARETIVWRDYSPEGLYNTPALRAQLEVLYTDGSREIFATDGSWKYGSGGLLASSYFAGELFDARKEPEGWALPGFCDADWQAVKVVDRLFNDPVTLAQEVFPQREVRKIKPISMHQAQPGVWVFALPETTTGYIELNLPAEQKSAVFVRPSEWVWREGIPADIHYKPRYPDGKIRELSEGMILVKRRTSALMSVTRELGVGYFTPIGITTWGIIPKGGAPIRYKPKFSLQVMRYLEVTGLDFEPDIDTLYAVTVRNDIPVTYDFTSSDPVLENVLAAAASSSIQNSQSMSWDNGTERNQPTWTWTWPAPLNTAVGDFSMLYRKFLRDQQLFVLPSGKTSGQAISPRAHAYRRGTFPLHETPVIDLPWVVLAYYGDQRAVQDYYPNIRKYVDFYWAGQRGEDYLAEIRAWKASGYTERRQINPKAPSVLSGDHCQGHDTAGLDYSPDSDHLYVNLGRWINILRKASWIADQMDQPEDKAYFNTLVSRIIDAIRASEMRYAETGTYGARRPLARGQDQIRELREGNPVSNAIAVWEGIATEDEYQALADITYNEIQKHYKGVITGGREWYRALYLLSQYGYMDHAVDFMTSKEFPSMGYFTEILGLTSVPESRLMRGDILWNSTSQSESQAYGNWFVEILCGIRFDPASPGMQDFVIAPIIPTNLEHASLSMNSPYGRIQSGWARGAEQTRMDITIPPNSRATVVVPTGNSVLFNGKPVDAVETVVPVEDRSEPNTYRVGAGHYTITWQPN